VFVMTQFLAASIYNWVISFVFVCIFHWIVDLCPANDCFIYDIFITWGHLMLMEAAVQLCVETLKNDFLATTAGLVFIGQNMLFSGFFRPVSTEPPAIQWLFYVFPIRWSFGGFAWKIYTTIGSFEVSGSNPVEHMEGRTILADYFHLKNIHAWGMFGTLLGYVLFLRYNQYCLMAMQTGHMKIPFSFGGSVSPSLSSKTNASGEGERIAVPTDEKDAGVQMTSVVTGAV